MNLNLILQQLYNPKILCLKLTLIFCTVIAGFLFSFLFILFNILPNKKQQQGSLKRTGSFDWIDSMVITRSDLRVPTCFITGGIIDREES